MDKKLVIGVEVKHLHPSAFSISTQGRRRHPSGEHAGMHPTQGPIPPSFLAQASLLSILKV